MSDSQVRPRRPERFGRFELTGRLRIGGMAEIFEARVAGETTDERFALKRILPSFTDEAEYVLMFLDESRLALKLSHTIRYSAEPPVGFDSTDTITAISIVARFKRDQ